MFETYTPIGHHGPAGWQPHYEYRVLGCRVIDGDTVDLILDLGFRTLLEDRFRLTGERASFDAPERRRPTLAEGNAAKYRLAELIRNTVGMRVVTERDLQNRAKQGKFGRYIARLYVYRPAHERGWVDVTEILRREGHTKTGEPDADP
jgi:endonuclease YncB( thermonuclease family)